MVDVRNALAGMVASLVVAMFGAFEARASDAVCANPQGSFENQICEDKYLMGINLQINLLLTRFVDEPTDPLPDWLQMEYAHHMIEFEECGDNFRCLEGAMRTYLGYLTKQYLENEDTPLAAYQDVRFRLFQSQDSPGNDLMQWNHPNNFGWTEKLCQLRCASDDRCAAAGYDVMQQLNNVYGYCTMKSRVKTPLSNWTSLGVLLVKQ